MKTKIKAIFMFLLTLMFFACAGEQTGKTINSQTDLSLNKPPLSQSVLFQTGLSQPFTSDLFDADTRRTLDEFAEVERAGSFFQGMAIAESGIRENAGDFAGAVAAAYKELSWAYGKGLIQKADLETGLLSILSINNERIVIAAADAILAFTRGQWMEAYDGFDRLFDEKDDPDGFARWMILVCALEINPEDRYAAAAYKSIRARYEHFPEYWYRGARLFSGAIAADFAERCINTAVEGPFAEECRSRLAVFTGLKYEDGFAIKTKLEIEAIISGSIQAGNPQLLETLLPLIALPDNPYTVFAVNALRNLCSSVVYRGYFNELSVSSRGRLAERLTYICRG